MIDPRTVLVAIPCYDGRVMAELCGALIQGARLFGAISLPSECSHISLARNLIAAQFMASPFEWLVCIDSDIVPSVRDLELLLEPCDGSALYYEDVHEKATHDTEVGLLPSVSETRLSASYPRPSRVITALTVDHQPLDRRLQQGAADQLVCAEYSFKNDTLEPVKLGMGFVRIHRSVFEQLQALQHDGGPTVEVRRDVLKQLQDYRDISLELNDVDYSRSDVEALLDSVEDKAGQPRLWQSSHKGRLYYDYFPSGPLISQFVPTAEWKGEDHGFFTLCMLAGIIPRIETRTRLIHMGRKGYPYLGPMRGAGQ